MILAPLQLIDYWMDAMHTRANPAYQPDKPCELDPGLIQLECEVNEENAEDATTHGTRWLVRLSIGQKLLEGKNIPYEFSIKLSGIIHAHPSLKDDQLKRAVEVNGPSMLFGSAREIIRAATGRGPFGPIIIPSTNFWQHVSKPPLTKDETPQASELNTNNIQPASSNSL